MREQGRPFRLGVLGGTFNPVHNGHIAMALGARAQFALDSVWLMPLGTPPHKPPADLASDRQRYQMVRLATGGHRSLRPSPMEIDRPGVTYTYDTMCALYRRIPLLRLFFIIGADTAAQIGSWYRPEGVLRMAEFIVVPRPGMDHALTERLRAQYGKANAARFHIACQRPLDIASSRIREWIRAGEPWEQCVPESVAAYIYAEGLYR